MSHSLINHEDDSSKIVIMSSLNCSRQFITGLLFIIMFFGLSISYCNPYNNKLILRSIVTGIIGYSVIRIFMTTKLFQSYMKGILRYSLQVFNLIPVAIIIAQLTGYLKLDKNIEYSIIIMSMLISYTFYNWQLNNKYYLQKSTNKYLSLQEGLIYKGDSLVWLGALIVIAVIPFTFTDIWDIVTKHHNVVEAIVISGSLLFTYLDTQLYRHFKYNDDFDKLEDLNDNILSTTKRMEKVTEICKTIPKEEIDIHPHVKILKDQDMYKNHKRNQVKAFEKIANFLNNNNNRITLLQAIEVIGMSRRTVHKYLKHFIELNLLYIDIESMEIEYYPSDIIYVYSLVDK